jgi:hypothetical protein
MSFGAAFFTSLVLCVMVYVAQTNKFKLDERTARIVKVVVFIICAVIVVGMLQSMS